MILSVNFLYASNSDPLTTEMQKYDKIFTRVSETRIGVSQKEIDNTLNPFLVKQESHGLINAARRNRIYFRLDALLDNKAKINGRWIKLYNKIGAYKLVKIKRSSVLLKNSKYTREIFIRKNYGSQIKFSSK